MPRQYDDCRDVVRFPMGRHLVLAAKQSRAALGASLDPFSAAAPLPNFRSYLSLFSAGRASLRAIPPGSPDGGAKRRMRRTTRAAHLSRFSAPLWPLSSVVFTVAAVKTMVFRMAAVRRRTFLLCVRREQGAIVA
ncbi:hypothetical protein A3BBH6_10960 [Alistipes onderdonkii subsp. vulgaris]|nr:hypothetical protein A3BBH6_10960 [Alistipes onderdonkii subsp. vulgaris]